MSFPVRRAKRVACCDMDLLCGHKSPRNYDHTRWAVCSREVNHTGDHSDGDSVWSTGYMPTPIPHPAPFFPEPKVGHGDGEPAPSKKSAAKRRQRKRQKARMEARIAELESQNNRALTLSALALERCEVAADPSGAADEAASLLRQFVTLDGRHVSKKEPMSDAECDHLWVIGGDQCVLCGMTWNPPNQTEAADMTKFTTEKFQGTVVLKDWFADPLSGRTIKGMMGRVTILEAKEMIGFDPGKSEANWIARVEGPASSYNFPGCQVRCVLDHPDHTEPHAGAQDLILVAP